MMRVNELVHLTGIPLRPLPFRVLVLAPRAQACREACFPACEVLVAWGSGGACRALAAGQGEDGAPRE